MSADVSKRYFCFVTGFAYGDGGSRTAQGPPGWFSNNSTSSGVIHRIRRSRRRNAEILWSIAKGINHGQARIRPSSSTSGRRQQTQ